MDDNEMESATEAFERALQQRGTEQYILRLYVSGMTPRSAAAIENIRALCEEHLHDRYDLEVVDVYQEPARAKDEQILAVPTLIKQLPKPLRKLIGDLSDRERVLVGLNIEPKTEE